MPRSCLHYCRSRGIYPEEVAAWRVVCDQATDSDDQAKAWVRQVQREDYKRIAVLQRELDRKEKVLAEAVALLVMRQRL